MSVAAGDQPAADIVRARRLAELGVLGVILVWGGNFVVVKLAITDLPPAAFAALRYALAGSALLLVLRLREGSIGLPRRDLAQLAVLGVIGYGLYQLLWTSALPSVSVGDSALIIATTPVLTAILAAAIGIDALTPAKLGGALIAFAGVAIVIGGGVGLGSTSSLVGELMTLAASGCWAVYTCFGARLLTRLTALRMTTWAIVFGALSMVPFGLAALAGLAAPLPAIAGAAGAILYAGLLAAGVSNVVVFHAVSLLGPTRITAFQFLIPAITVVLGAVILAEPITAAQVIGGLVIVAGVLLTRRGPAPRPRRAAGSLRASA